MPPRRRRPPAKTAARNRAGAEGSVWHRIVKGVVARDHGVCHICHHPGAKSADHLIPVAERPDLSLSAANLKAAHAYPAACPVCSSAAQAKGGKPVYCNEIRNALSVERARRLIEMRTGLALGGSAKDEPRGERDWLHVAAG